MYQSQNHNPIIGSIRCSTNAPGQEAHHNGKKRDRKTYDMCSGDGLSSAVVDVGQLILGFRWGKAIIDSPVDCLRSHIDKCSESETLILGKPVI